MAVRLSQCSTCAFEVPDVWESAAIEKVIFHIVSATVQFAFGARAIRLMGLDGEAIVIGKIEKLPRQIRQVRSESRNG